MRCGGNDKSHEEGRSGDRAEVDYRDVSATKNVHYQKKSKLTVMALMGVLSKVQATFSLLKDIDTYIFNS